MKNVVFIIVMLLLFSCKSYKNEKVDTDISWEHDEAMLPKNEVVVKDSFEINRNKLITQLETQRDKTLVAINKIEYDLRDKASEEARESIQSLNEKQKIITNKIESLKTASKDAIEKMKIGIDSAIVDLEIAIKKIRSKFEKKDK